MSDELQHTATHCNTLQHTATHCNSLQLSVTHCGTLHVASVSDELQCVSLKENEGGGRGLPPFGLVCLHACGDLVPNMLMAFAGEIVVIHRNTLHHPATHYNALQHTATHCHTLPHTATHCNTIQQHTAMYCNTLHHNATHCNTLQHTEILCPASLWSSQVGSS